MAAAVSVAVTAAAIAIPLVIESGGQAIAIGNNTNDDQSMTRWRHFVLLFAVVACVRP